MARINDINKFKSELLKNLQVIYPMGVQIAEGFRVGFFEIAIEEPYAVIYKNEAGKLVEKCTVDIYDSEFNLVQTQMRIASMFAIEMTKYIDRFAR